MRRQILYDMNHKSQTQNKSNKSREWTGFCIQLKLLCFFFFSLGIQTKITFLIKFFFQLFLCFFNLKQTHPKTNSKTKRHLYKGITTERIIECKTSTTNHNGNSVTLIFYCCLPNRRFSFPTIPLLLSLLNSFHRQTFRCNSKYNALAMHLGHNFSRTNK